MTISDEAKAKVSAVLKVGERAVDATMGNGWDTLFLAERVGVDGEVFAFDVQKAAIEATGKRLKKEGLLSCCSLHLTGHENMGGIVPCGVGAVMFNLGYLPYAKRETITSPVTTLLALGAAAGLLRAGGVMTIICYRGHAGGQEEAQAVLDFVWPLKSVFSIEAPKELPAGDQAFLVTLHKHQDNESE